MPAHQVGVGIKAGGGLRDDGIKQHTCEYYSMFLVFFFCFFWGDTSRRDHETKLIDGRASFFFRSCMTCISCDKGKGSDWPGRCPKKRRKGE